MLLFPAIFRYLSDCRHYHQYFNKSLTLERIYGVLIRVMHRFECGLNKNFLWRVEEVNFSYCSISCNLCPLLKNAFGDTQDKQSWEAHFIKKVKSM